MNYKTINIKTKLSEIRHKKDFVILIVILLLPFSFYLYNLAPNTRVWDTFFFKIDSGFIDDANYYMWMVFVRLMTLMILSIWFITCSHIWRSVILVSIICEIYKFGNILKAANLGMDYKGLSLIETIYYSVPFIIVLLLISKKLNYYKSYNNDLNPLNNEINKLINFDKKHYKSVKKELKILEAQKQIMNKKKYLSKLIELRDQLNTVN